MNFTIETQGTLRKTYEEVFSLRFLSSLTLRPRPTKLSSLNETIPTVYEVCSVVNKSETICEA